MKKKIISIGLIFTLCLTGCSVQVKEDSIVSNYSVDMQNDYVISTDSSLGFKLVDIDPTEGVDNVYFLAYLEDDNIEVNVENQYVKSLSVGKNCISITSAVMDVGRNLNRNIVLDLLDRLSTQVNNEEVIKLWENLENPAPYIISKNDKYVFIDYITTIPNSINRVMYYRLILQDVSILDNTLSEEELAVLPDNLPELLNILGVSENIELPKQDMQPKVREVFIEKVK